MAQPVILAVNTTGSPIDLDQLGVTVPSLGSADVTVDNTTAEVLNDDELDTAVNAGDITLTVDTEVLSPASSRVYMRQRAFYDGALKNVTAIAGPGVGNDNTQGYGVGSLWIDIIAGDLYFLFDAATGVAFWKQIATGSGYNDVNNILANQVFS